MKSDHSLIRLGLCPLALLLWVGYAAADAETPTGADAGRQSTESLEGQVDGLNRRVQGMADKLKDSAAARKAADQARMEAERRLAEVVQENHGLNAELGLLRDAKIALEVARDNAQEREAKSNAALTAARESLRRLGAERDARDRRIGELEQAQAHLKAELDASNAELKRLRVDLGSISAERDNLARRLDAMRSLVPADEGGSLTLEEARSRAGEAAQALRAAAQAAQSGRTQDRRERWDAEQELHRRQLTVVRASGARSVYRVRPHDSPGLIARRLYGDSSRWREISEANRHVLPDPDHLTPGMSLVVP